MDFILLNKSSSGHTVGRLVFVRWSSRLCFSLKSHTNYSHSHTFPSWLCSLPRTEITSQFDLRRDDSAHHWGWKRELNLFYGPKTAIPVCCFSSRAGEWIGVCGHDVFSQCYRFSDSAASSVSGPAGEGRMRQIEWARKNYLWIREKRRIAVDPH